MSANAQIIWFTVAILFFLFAAFNGWYSTPGPERRWSSLHFGWLGLAAFTVVYWWTAVQAS